MADPIKQCPGQTLKLQVFQSILQKICITLSTCYINVLCPVWADNTIVWIL